MKKNIHILVSGGGTGGHIFPAVSIANALKEKMPDSEIFKDIVCRSGRQNGNGESTCGWLQD